MKRFIFIISIFSLFLLSCESPVSLGSRLSLAGPQVNIAKPSPDLTVDETDPAVRTVFNVSGTIKDDVKITLMTVTLDYWNAEADELTRMGREWKWEKEWLSRESEDDEWEPYTETGYNPIDADPRFPASPPAWEVNKNIVNWNLPVNMNRMEQGEYFITVSAWNSAGRHDSQSSAKLKIKYNNFSPAVRIINPLLFSGSGSLAFPKAPSWEEYIFDPFNAPEETSLNLMYFTNSFNDLSYQLEYTISPPTEFSFELTNEHDLDDLAEEKTTYYRWQWEGEDFPPQRGIFTDRPAEIGEAVDTYIKAGGRIELGDTVEKTLPRDSVTPMQLVTRVKDATGLEEYKSKGWFLYLPDSDKPYPFIDFAYRVNKDAAPPADAAELATMLRGSTNYNNLAYDDDGVKELRWTVYKLKDGSLEVERAAGSSGITFEGNKKEPWGFQAHKSFGTGRFKIIVQVQDIYGTWGDEFYGYFTIFSNATPTVVTPLDSPESLTATFWGDEYGNITIAGRAQIEDYDECDGVSHGIRVNDVIIAWIKPGLGVENNFRYLDINDPLWDAAEGADFYGNKIWKPGLSFVAGTEGNNNINTQEEWAFSQTFNYFSDLGIGLPPKLAFTDQQFRIRVLSRGGVNALPRSSVYAFTTRCDVAPPLVEITHIVIKHESEDTEYDLATSGVLPVITQGDEIMLKGTYSDDSIGQWSGLGPNRHNDYLTGFTVNWEGEQNKFNFNNNIASFTLDTPDGGNWETGWYAFTVHNLDPIVQLSAGLTDAAGRRGNAHMVLIIETADPVLVRISSDFSDGYYGNNKPTVPTIPGSRYIDIYLEFNKPISFIYPGSPPFSSTNAPYLELNNNGRAFYLPPGQGEDQYQYKIAFRYFVNGLLSPPLVTATPSYGGDSSPVESGNDEGRLNVTRVVFGSSFGEEHWKGISDIPAIFNKDGDNNLLVCDAGNDYSLAQQKRIIIDKDAPKIAAVTSSSVSATEKRYGLGSEINIEVRFNENVQITGMKSDNTSLSLTGGTLAGNLARADYQNVKDSTSINFLYIVAGNHNTSANPPQIPTDQFLGVSLMNMSEAVITDVAGNIAVLDIPDAPVYFNNVIIDTIAPPAPSIAGIVPESYYGSTTFYIAGIDSGNTVEYNINHALNPTSGWTFHNNGQPVNAAQTGAIGLDINGIYQIAARQWDTAIPPNCSPVSAVLGPVRVDRGGILQRITSSLPDGSYSADARSDDKKIVTIDLEFRIPVTLVGDYTDASITLNTINGSTQNAKLTSAPAANSRKWTFTYTDNASNFIPSGARTPLDTYLDVTALNFDSVTINDQYGTQVNKNNWLTLNTLDATPDRKLKSQKQIIILSGRPSVVNVAAVTGNVLASGPAAGGIEFTGTQLKLTFDRDIYRGLTAGSLLIQQITDGYRIPAVLTEDRWSEIFINRTTNWEALGRTIYEPGSNGVTVSWNDAIASDPSTKWVLRYDIDPDNLTGSITFPVGTGGSTTNLAWTTIVSNFRSYESLSFTPNDPQVTINGRDLIIDLSSGRSLPVKGARYYWNFPNGFVQDVLGTANGTGDIDDDHPTGNDTNLTSGQSVNGIRVLFYDSATDPPVIRVNKNPAVTFTDATAFRQIRQPVTTEARINSRTPNATIQYWSRQTTDNVSKLLTYYSRFPIVEGNWDNYSLGSMRPQSGTDGYRAPDDVTSYDWHVNSWGPRYFVNLSGALYDPATWGAASTYTAPIPIGSANYTDGGMIINFRAQATAPNVTAGPTDYGYEFAYRSVFVYINQSYTVNISENYDYHPAGTYNVTAAGSTRLHQLEDGTLLTSNLDRVWIRGSDNLIGDSSRSYFPLSRDLTKSRKAKLLTPMWLGSSTTTPTITADTTLTDTQIPVYGDTDEYRQARGHWYWVTWDINVPAYIDIFYGELPTNAAAPQIPTSNLRYLLGGSVEFKRHYPVIPGRTTVYQGSPREIWIDRMPQVGRVGHKIGSEFIAPTPEDLGN